MGNYIASKKQEIRKIFEIIDLKKIRFLEEKKIKGIFKIFVKNEKIKNVKILIFRDNLKIYEKKYIKKNKIKNSQKIFEKIIPEDFIF